MYYQTIINDNKGWTYCDVYYSAFEYKVYNKAYINWNSKNTEMTKYWRKIKQNNHNKICDHQTRIPKTLTI